MFRNKTLGFQGHHLPTLAYVCVIQGRPAPLTDAYVSMGTDYDASIGKGAQVARIYGIWEIDGVERPSQMKGFNNLDEQNRYVSDEPEKACQVRFLDEVLQTIIQINDQERNTFFGILRSLIDCLESGDNPGKGVYVNANGDPYSEDLGDFHFELRSDGLEVEYMVLDDQNILILRLDLE